MPDEDGREKDNLPRQSPQGHENADDATVEADNEDDMHIPVTKEFMLKSAQRNIFEKEKTPCRSSPSGKCRSSPPRQHRHHGPHQNQKARGSPDAG